MTTKNDGGLDFGSGMIYCVVEQRFAIESFLGLHRCPTETSTDAPGV
jgi:hypothetical protein